MSREGADLWRTELGTDKTCFNPVNILQALKPSKGKQKDEVHLPDLQIARQTIEGVQAQELRPA